MPPHQFLCRAETKLKASHVLGTHSINWASPLIPSFYNFHNGKIIPHIRKQTQRWAEPQTYWYFVFLFQCLWKFFLAGVSNTELLKSQRRGRDTNKEWKTHLKAELPKSSRCTALMSWIHLLQDLLSFFACICASVYMWACMLMQWSPEEQHQIHWSLWPSCHRCWQPKTNTLKNWTTSSTHEETGCSFCILPHTPFYQHEASPFLSYGFIFLPKWLFP